MHDKEPCTAGLSHAASTHYESRVLLCHAHFHDGERRPNASVRNVVLKASVVDHRRYRSGVPRRTQRHIVCYFHTRHAIVRLHSLGLTPYTLLRRCTRSCAPG